MIWLQFIALAGCVVSAGVKLTKFGDIIAAKTGVGRVIIGIIFLSAISSLPEAVVVITSGYIGDANLAVGTLLGSNMFNLFILAVGGFVIGTPLFYRLRKEHIFTALLGIFLTLMVLIGIVTKLGYFFPAWRVGPISILILLIYFTGMHFIFKYEMKTRLQEDRTAHYKSLSSLKVYSGAFITAVIIVIAGIYLTRTADSIAKIPIGEVEIGATFVGSIFLALTTSLPELVISLAAVKMTLYDMAAANILGSIVFNYAIIFLADIFYQGGDILFPVASTHIISGFFVTGGIGVVILSLIHRSSRRILRLGWGEWGISLLYLLWATLLFRLR